MSSNEQNNDLSCLVLLIGKVLFCLIVSVLSATAGGAAVCQEWRLDESSRLIKSGRQVKSSRLDKKWEEMSLIFL